MCGEFRDLAGGDYYGTPFWGRHPLEGGGRMSCGWFFFVRPLERKHRTQTHAMCIGFWKWIIEILVSLLQKVSLKKQSNYSGYLRFTGWASFIWTFRNISSAFSAKCSMTARQKSKSSCPWFVTGTTFWSRRQLRTRRLLVMVFVWNWPKSPSIKTRCCMGRGAGAWCRSESKNRCGTASSFTKSSIHLTCIGTKQASSSKCSLIRWCSK